MMQTIINTSEIKDWFAHQPSTERVSEGSPYFTCNGLLPHKGNKIELMVQLTEYNDDNSVQDKLIIIDGAHQKSPVHGEIWLPKYLANNYQIQIGDTIDLPGPSGSYPVVVSATVADPLYGSGMVNPTRAWLASGELPFFIPVTQLSNIQLGIRLNNADSTSALWDRYTRQFNYTGVHLTYSLFKNAYMGVYQIMGNIILAFSIMALLIALFMVRTAITRAVYDDYKLTGVYKALGFTPGNIVSLYVIQYSYTLHCFYSSRAGWHLVHQQAATGFRFSKTRSCRNSRNCTSGTIFYFIIRYCCNGCCHRVLSKASKRQK